MVIQGILKSLQKNREYKYTKSNDLFQKPEVSNSTFDYNMLPDIIKSYMKVCPEVVLNSKCYTNLISSLLLIPFIMKDDSEIKIQIYTIVYFLLSAKLVGKERTRKKPPKEETKHEIENKEKELYSASHVDLIKDLLNHEFLKKIFDHLPTDINDRSKLKDEQKIIYQIYLLIRNLDLKHPSIDSIYKYNNDLLELERSVLVCQERRKFDFVSYLSWPDKLEANLDTQGNTISTFKNRYNHKFCSRHVFKKATKIKLEIASESKFKKNAYILFSKDKEGKIPFKQLETLNCTSESFEITNDSFYLHYPIFKTRIECFGDQENGKLGTNQTSCFTEDITKVSNFEKELSIIRQCANYTLALSKDSILYRCGQKEEWDQIYTEFVEYKEDNNINTKIIDFKVGPQNYGVLTSKGKLYAQGMNDNNQLSFDCCSSKTLRYLLRPSQRKEKILNFDIGSNYIIYTTDNGKCYASGSSILESFGINCDSDTENNEENIFSQIDFPEGVIPIKPFPIKLDEEIACIMLVSNQGKNELWSFCDKEEASAVAGQGKEVQEHKRFAPLDYDKNINFVDVSVFSNWALAVTDQGELYGWGSNKNNLLSISDDQEYFKPIQLDFFKDYFVKDFKCGTEMGLVNASPKDNLNCTKFFMIGDVKGLSNSEKISKGIYHYKCYDNLKYSCMEAGDKTNFISIYGDDSIKENVNIHHEYECYVTRQKPIVGTMHFWKQGPEWVYLSEEGYKTAEETKAVEIPNICYVTKTYIKDIPNKKWTNFEEEKLLDSQVPKEFKPIYLSNCFSSQAQVKDYEKLLKIENEEERKMKTNMAFNSIQSDEDSIFREEAHDINPCIFYRLAKPLKPGCELPIFILSNYFEHMKDDFLKVNIKEITYNYNEENIQNKKEFDKYVTSLKEFDEKKDAILFSEYDKYYSKLEDELLDNIEHFSQESILEFYDKLKEDTNKFESLDKPIEDIYARIKAYLYFNHSFTKLKPFITQNQDFLNSVTSLGHASNEISINQIFIKSKDLIFQKMKTSYLKSIYGTLPPRSSEATIDYDRIEIQANKDKDMVDHNAEWTMFSRTMNRCKKNNYASLRVNKSDIKAWTANFVGEGSIDDGGPYRDSITNISEELHSKYLPLLIPTQNNKNDHGFGRDLWTLNPASTSPIHLEMFKFLGAMIGMAFRSGQVIDLKLCSIFWKKLVNESPTLEDLDFTDAYAVQFIKDVENVKLGISKEEFKYAMELTWTTQLSNGETVPVCEGGEEKPVQYEEVDDYHKKVIETRIHESDKQFNAVKQGFDLIFPTSCLSILSWREVELRVVGPSTISVEDLKSITYYSNCCPDNEYVQRFWRVFEKFTNKEKSMFLKFTWGRSKLPSVERLGDQKLKFLLFDSDQFDDHDIHFPEAHTCYFQFDFPRYTNDESCREKMLYAIESCGGIDTDQTVGGMSDSYDDSDEENSDFESQEDSDSSHNSSSSY